MIIKKIQLIFIVLIIFSSVILLLNWYNSYSFKNTPLSNKYQLEIQKEEQRVLSNMQKNLGFKFKVPLIITDKIPGQVYGVTSLRDNGEIKIYLNKKVMKESFDYIISNVIAHEYAHALLYKNGYYQNGGEGHSSLWKKTCQKLGGKNCQKYVDSHDVIMGKLPF